MLFRSEAADVLPPKKILGFSRKAANKRAMNKFAKAPSLSPAQDEFVKLATSVDKEAFAKTKVANIIKKLGETDGAELSKIIKNVNDEAVKGAKIRTVFERFKVKNRREVIPFLLAGAGLGFLFGVTRNVFRTDVKYA